MIYPVSQTSAVDWWQREAQHAEGQVAVVRVEKGENCCV